MSIIFGFLLIGCLLALPVGLLKPTLVLWWSKSIVKTRRKVLAIYGIGVLASMLLIGIFAQETEQRTNEAAHDQKPVTQRTTDNNKTTDASAGQTKETQTAVTATDTDANHQTAAKEMQQPTQTVPSTTATEPVEKPADEAFSQPEWNKSDPDMMSNGNLQLAVSMLQAMEQLPKGTHADAEQVLKTPWNYYGKALTFTGQVAVVEDYPPSSDTAQMGIQSDIVIESTDGTIVEFFSLVPSGSIKVGDQTTITGYPIGRTEVENRLGGNFTHLMVVTKKL
ncbi:hypothetical protein [Paenibacillus wenxiniae]|uniref:Uncharacterized protein n=1 Tax=Paenibacillus wenxiniae TaxID=1636843 RepID=A0ABW4RFW6_9BACL